RTNGVVFCCLLAVGFAVGSRATAVAAERPNVLFIAIDDLRNHLGCLGVEHAKTPNLDALAARGRMFTHHYVHVPTCGASRCALLRGRYPTERAHLGNGAIAQTHKQWGERSLPAWFRRHGYRTLSLGKITHHPGGRTGAGWAEGPEELPGAWDRCWIPESPWENALSMMHGYANGVPRRPGKSPPWEAFDGPDEAYPDAWVARDAAATLRELAGSEQPWFFAVGFFKPHLPFAAPKKYFDMHDPDRISAPAATERAKVKGGWHGSGEFRGNYGHAGRDPEKDPEYARLMRQGYAAATTYVDAQVGRLLDAFEELDLAGNTVVVVWGDHGFLLGEHAIWGKHCLYEHALRSPLIFQYPGMPDRGKQSDAVVETVDVYPTLLDVCRLPAPEGLDGRSLRPQLVDPAAASPKPALGFWGNDRTVRTERFRYTRYGSGDEQLYDYEADLDETRNLAGEPEFADTIRKLSEHLR
ncbi:MAG: sulfatase, partial [Thermoguttaceae bacterium]